jgi:virulence-associated protein VagC
MWSSLRNSRCCRAASWVGWVASVGVFLAMCSHSVSAESSTLSKSRASAPADLANPANPANPVNVAAIMPVSEIRPGMKGYGLTVFYGTEPTRFEVEVIDVLHNFRPSQDLILVRTPHPILNAASSVGGMSGSPVYIEGKLIGAYAYGWPFGKEPVAGVTPIQNMLTELQRAPHAASEPPARPVDPRKSRPEPPSMQTSHAMAEYTDPFSRLEPLVVSGRSALADHDMPRMATTPLYVSGFSDAMVQFLRERLQPLGLVPLQGGAAASPPSSPVPSSSSASRGTSAAWVTRPRPFRPGDAIGVQLMRGDISTTAVGTVTDVRGDKLSGFGHPLLNAGEVELPTAHVKVVHVLQSYNRSFKLAESTETHGTLTQDRDACVVVDMSRRAPTVPVRIRLQGLPTGVRSQWNVEVAHHRLLTPMLVFGALANAIQTSVSDTTDVTVYARSALKVNGLATPVQVDDVAVGRAGLMDPMALGRLRVFALIDATYNNPFERTHVESIDITARVVFGRNVAEVVDVASTTDEVEPGDVLPVSVTLRRYNQPEHVAVYRIPIPMSLAGSEVEIAVESGDQVVEPQPEPTTLSQVFGVIAAPRRANELVFSVTAPSKSLRLRGHVLNQVPQSVADVFQSAHAANRGQPLAAHTRHVFASADVLRGSARLKVRVREFRKTQW